MNLTRDNPPTANRPGTPMARHVAGRPQVAHALPRSPAEALVPHRPPEPPEQDYEEDRHPFLRMLDGMFNFVFIVLCAAIAVFYLVRIEFDRPGPLQVSTVLVVPKGEGVTAIADRLESEGIIADRRIFMTSILYFMYVKGQGTLKAGEYKFDKHATMRQVLDTLVEGKSIEYRVTFPEGWTSQQIVDRLKAHPDLGGDIPEVPAEGSLLPDTYSFGTKDTRQDILQRMQVAQQKFLTRLWNERDPDIMVKTPQEAVTLASIVEKETGVAEERPRIASVFHNRLRKKMRLQSDPTIIYGLFGGAGMRDHPISQQEIDRPNPYNTYKIDGLPPTPIGNPGRASIEAVLKPAKTDDLYFVASGNGGHVFAASLAEHNKNVAKWRKIEREIRARQAEEAAAAAAASSDFGMLLPEGQVGLMVADGPVPLPKRNPQR